MCKAYCYLSPERVKAIYIIYGNHVFGMVKLPTSKQTTLQSVIILLYGNVFVMFFCKINS